MTQRSAKHVLLEVLAMQAEVRLPYLKPEDLNEEQKEFYEAHAAAMQSMPYIWKWENGGLNGPSNALIHNVGIGKMVFPLSRAIIGNSLGSVGGGIHAIVALVTVGAARAQYAMYANGKLAQGFGLSDRKIASILAGQRPSDLTADEAIAYDLALSLSQSGPVPGPVFSQAIEKFGENGVAALVFVAGFYKLVGTILNAFNEPAPAYP
ncbi:MAG: hypothetical protein M1274_15285 [Actinobacteria bacterium]|nr:hypothetical protein [Actinomycetota bacterium]